MHGYLKTKFYLLLSYFYIPCPIYLSCFRQLLKLDFHDNNIIIMTAFLLSIPQNNMLNQLFLHAYMNIEHKWKTLQTLYMPHFATMLYFLYKYRDAHLRMANKNNYIIGTCSAHIGYKNKIDSTM